MRDLGGTGAVADSEVAAAKGGLGHGPALPRFSQGSNRGIWRALGYRRAALDGSALETKKGQTLACPLGTRTL